MLLSENKFRRQRMGGVEFNPTANLWVQQQQTCNSIRIRLKVKSIGHNLMIIEAYKFVVSHSF